MLTSLVVGLQRCLFQSIKQRKFFLIDLATIVDTQTA
jgi:hypothetical protein